MTRAPVRQRVSEGSNRRDQQTYILEERASTFFADAVGSARGVGRRFTFMALSPCVRYSDDGCGKRGVVLRLGDSHGDLQRNAGHSPKVVMTAISIGYFMSVVLITLLITLWAATRSSGRASFYAASSQISGWQNGFAMAGDYLSAGTVLGAVGLYSLIGVNLALYLATPIAGMCLMMVLIVGPLRRLGRYTLGDVVSAKLPHPRTRLAVAVCTVTISLLYLVAQLVGAGALISIVFDLEFATATIAVGLLMTAYVAFGGMLAATWVQIVKCALLLAAVLFVAVLSVLEAGGLPSLYEKALLENPPTAGLFTFGGQGMGVFSALSLAVGMIAGTMGLPHLLIRFFTVRNETVARRSLVIATLLIGAAMSAVILIVGPAALAFVVPQQQFHTVSGALIGGSNMMTLHLSKALGGDVFFGVMSAIAFSTILAVVAGLNITISSTVAHDVFAVLRRGAPSNEKAELRVFRLSAFATAAVAVGIAILLQHQNITFLIVLGTSMAASTTFPLLMLAIYWKRLTVPGVVACAAVGLSSTVALIILSPSCWVKVFGHARAVFPSDYPALIALPITLAATWMVSTLTQRGSMNAGTRGLSQNMNWDLS
jgi:cation/acetate symporter